MLHGFAWALALALLGSPAQGVTGRDEPSIDNLLNGLPVSQSIEIIRVSDGKVLWERNPDTLLSPASVTKVITSAAALALFSPVHSFKTPLFYTGSRENGRVSGDLIIVGDGDPFIVSEKLWQLGADMRNLGIREFTGDLIIDNSLFDSQVRDESRKDSALLSQNAYNSPISAFGVNFNTVAITVAPNTSSGRPALVSTDPYNLRDLSLDNRIQTSRSGTQKSIQIKRTTTGTGDKFTASGSIPVDSGLLKIYRSVGNPISASGEYVRAFLKNEGVIIGGKVKAGRKPEGATLLMELEGYEMRRIVAGLNTYSNNYIADVLLKRMGASFPRAGEPDVSGQGNYINGLGAVTNFLRKQVGISGEFVLKNGSGLDTENRLSARQVTSILLFMEKRMDLFPDFLASLPAVGWDGTMKKRLKTVEDVESLQGLIRAKTGTLTEPVTVASIAGYLRHPKHGLIAFSVLENGRLGEPQPSLSAVRERQDRLLALLLETSFVTNENIEKDRKKQGSRKKLRGIL